METLLSLSDDLAGAVERAGRAVVAVNARPRLASTGIHWRAGFIVTADHTVAIEEDLTVTRPDGQTVSAALVGRDPGTDLAVLKLAQADLPVAAIGDPGALKVGHLALALGAGPSASWGVISALGGSWRTWRGGEIDRLVRLDLTLYPGFSGGPLVNPQGQVVGLNTSGLSRHFNLAIPASTVTRVTDELVRTGRIRRGYLGLGMQPVRLPETLRGTLGLTREGALIVVNVEPDGPAGQAGLLLGDIVVGLDGRPVSDTDDVQALLQRVGTTVRVSILRAGEPREVPIVTGERPQRTG